MEENYLDINKELWNNKTEVHIASEFYGMKEFLAGKSSLKEIELALLGDIKGKSILHLQCHFGQDSISLARMGASVVGVDFSEKAIAKAKELAIETNTDTQFVCCDVYSTPQFLDRKFDLVFTSYGTIGWLPDMDKWANVVSHFLKDNGRFIFVDFHPIVWMFDNNFTKIQYHYFNKEAIVETLDGTYADRNAPLKNKEIGWNHSLTEVMTALMANDLTINTFDEYNYSPYNCFTNMEEYEQGKFRIKQFENKIPMIYSLVFSKKKGN